MNDLEVCQTFAGMIDDAIVREAEKDDPFRAHLGGSMIGRACDREIWYGFRWAKAPKFEARMHRLFQRGHKEEFTFVKHLRAAGFIVQEYAQRLCRFQASGEYICIGWEEDVAGYGPDVLEDVSDAPEHLQLAEHLGIKLKQWRISNHSNHFGGSLDGKAWPPFQIAGISGQILLEFKTHNKDSFAKLIKEREESKKSAEPWSPVKKVKPEHWAQMQTYMEHEDLDAALYCAVCKDNDDRYYELVRRDKEAGQKYIERAHRIIHSVTAPERVGKHPSWFECKFCSYQAICHYNEAPDRNCRSCKFSVPVENGAWHCTQFRGIIPEDFILKSCNAYQPIHD